MDPDAAIKDLLDALEGSETEEAAEIANALRGWLKDGGFVPNVELLDASGRRRLFMLFCETVIDLDTALAYPDQD